MTIKLYRTPVRSDSAVVVEVEDDVLTINGETLDLSAVDEPTSLPSPFIVGEVFRLNGDVHVRVVAPYGADQQPSEADEMPLPPTPEAPLAFLTARQLRLGLVLNGFTPDQVTVTIDAIEDEQDRAVAKVEWEYASQFERDHPLIDQVGTALGLTSGQIDTMWEAALAL